MPEELTRPDPSELARLMVEAVNRRDVDALLAYAVADVVYDTTPSGFGVYRGKAAIREFVEGYWAMFDELSFELEEFSDMGGGVTLTINRQYARPAGSSGRVQAREAHVTEWRDGLAVRVTVYIDLDEARAAAERAAAERR
jgi:ketosteroid isomerase-like protein